MRIRRRDVISMVLVAGALFAVVVVTVIAGQPPQEALNATLLERVANIAERQNRLENLINVAIGALIANFVAHWVQIRGRSDGRRKTGG